MKLNKKFILSITAGLILLAGLVVVVTMFGSKQFLDIFLLEKAKSSQNSWRLLEQSTKDELGAVLSALTTNDGLRDKYLSGNKDELYGYAAPLFETLKNQYAITHWYFILPDGKIFLRMHKKALSGDSAEARKTFQAARDTRKLSSGIELGGTAYALRTVLPYFDNNQKLIGYLELAKDMNHLLLPLSSVSGSRMALFADKKHLDRNAWAWMAVNSGARDAWNDLEEHVITNDFGEDDFFARECFSDKNSEAIEGESVRVKITQTKKTFLCSGFPINDIKGTQIGALLSLTDLTNQAQAITRWGLLKN